MFGVKKSPLPFALPFVEIFLFGSYNTYGLSQLPLPTNHMDLIKPYSNFNLQQTPPMTTSNLMLYLQQNFHLNSL